MTLTPERRAALRVESLPRGVMDRSWNCDHCRVTMPAGTKVVSKRENQYVHEECAAAWMDAARIARRRRRGKL